MSGEDPKTSETRDELPATEQSGEPAHDTPRTRRTRWRWIKWTIRIGVLFVLAGLLMRGCDSWFYYPSNAVLYESPKKLALEYEDVYFQASDGVKLHGWYIPNQSRVPTKGTVVHFHGNAENITTHVTQSAWLPQYGYNLLVFDYRGYGKSEGRVTREGTIRDGHAALDYVLSREDTDPTRICFFGQSLGGAVAVVVAADRDEVAAVALDSPFDSYQSIATAHAAGLVGFEALGRMLAGVLVSDGYDPIEVVDQLKGRPVLFLAAERDEICYEYLVRRLYEAARQPKHYAVAPDTPHLAILAEHQGWAIRQILACFDPAIPFPPEQAPGRLEK